MERDEPPQFGVRYTATQQRNPPRSPNQNFSNQNQVCLNNQQNFSGNRNSNVIPRKINNANNNSNVITPNFNRNNRNFGNINASNGQNFAQRGLNQNNWRSHNATSQTNQTPMRNTGNFSNARIFANSSHPNQQTANRSIGNCFTCNKPKNTFLINIKGLKCKAMIDSGSMTSIVKKHVTLGENLTFITF